MSAARYTTIWCDGKTEWDGVEHDCGEYVEGDTAALVRREAGRPGRGRWLVGLPGSRDLCPNHLDQRDAVTRWGE